MRICSTFLLLAVFCLQHVDTATRYSSSRHRQWYGVELTSQVFPTLEYSQLIWVIPKSQPFPPSNTPHLYSQILLYLRFPSQILSPFLPRATLTSLGNLVAMQMTVPKLPKAGTYLWPGLQDTANTGVYQEVLDGRSGTSWIGSEWCCKCVSVFLQSSISCWYLIPSNPNLPWGDGFNVHTLVPCTIRLQWNALPHWAI